MINDRNMKAMVFAAGVGSRLRPFTDSHPKALLPVCGQPIIGRVLDNIVKAGIEDVIVNVHHHASQIVDYLDGNYRGNISLQISDETDLLLDTGGGLLKAAPMLWQEGGHDKAHVLLHNADILTDIDLHEMVGAHLRSGADVTLLASGRESSRMLYFDPVGRLKGWRNQKTGETKPRMFDAGGLTPMAFGGVHVVSPRVHPLLEEYSRSVGPVFSIMPFYLDHLVGLDVRAYVPEADYIWHDVGSREKHSAAEAALARRMGRR